MPVRQSDYERKKAGEARRVARLARHAADSPADSTDTAGARGALGRQHLSVADMTKHISLSLPPLEGLPGSWGLQRKEAFRLRNIALVAAGSNPVARAAVKGAHNRWLAANRPPPHPNLGGLPMQQCDCTPELWAKVLQGRAARQAMKDAKIDARASAHD